MALRNYRVDFREKGPDQQRFYKAFTFALAATEQGAVARVRNFRTGSEVEILSVKEVRR